MSVACFPVPSSFEEVGGELYMCASCELYILIIFVVLFFLLHQPI